MAAKQFKIEVRTLEIVLAKDKFKADADEWKKDNSKKYKLSKAQQLDYDAEVKKWEKDTFERKKKGLPAQPKPEPPQPAQEHPQEGKVCAHLQFLTLNCFLFCLFQAAAPASSQAGGFSVFFFSLFTLFHSILRFQFAFGAGAGAGAAPRYVSFGGGAGSGSGAGSAAAVSSACHRASSLILLCFGSPDGRG
jgi:hypothetical protein